MNEASLLWSIHGLSSPGLDALFRASHELGTLGASALLVAGASLWHLARGERRHAAVWVAVGLSTLLLYLALKPAFGRARPRLWPPLVTETDPFAFPSGHALMSATFYPLLAWASLRLRRVPLVILGVGVPLFVGFGRLYLGVHWPTDVLAGWALGAVQCAAAARALRPRPLAK